MAHVASLPKSAKSSVLLLTGADDGCGPVQVALEEAGIAVKRLGLGSAALVEAVEAAPSAIILDGRFDVGAAGKLCRSVRAVEGLNAVHLVGVTNAGDAESRLRLYEAGADDCWTFAGEPGNLVRRARELVRPPLLRETPQVLTRGVVALDPERYTVTCSGRTAQLTAMQLKLLSHFMKYPGVVFSHRELLDDVWRNPDGDERMVRAGIVRLRRVLGMGAGPSGLIKTVRGGGYAFDENGHRASNSLA